MGHACNVRPKNGWLALLASLQTEPRRPNDPIGVVS